MDPPTYHTVHWNDCGDGSLSRLIYLLVGGGPKWLRANCLDSDDNGGSSSSSPPPLPSSPKVTPHLSVEAAVLSAPVPPTPYCCPLSTNIQQHVHPDHVQRWFTLAKPQPRGPGRENSEAWLTVIIRCCHTSTPSSTRRALSTFFAVAELPTENPGIVDIRRLSSLWYGGFCPLPQIILTRICTRNLNFMVIISKEVSSNYFFASETEQVKETTLWKVGGTSLTSSTSICQIDVKPLLFLRFKSNLIFNVLEISPPGCFAFQSLLLIKLTIHKLMGIPGQLF